MDLKKCLVMEVLILVGIKSYRGLQVTDRHYRVCVCVCVCVCVKQTALAVEGMINLERGKLRDRVTRL